MVAKNLLDFGASFWFCPSLYILVDRVRPDVNPFVRDVRIQAELQESILGFVYGNNSETLLKSGKSYFPYFDGIDRGLFDLKFLVRTALSHYYVGETPAVKFMALEGVIDMKFKFNVCFAPLTFKVWLTFLVSVYASLLVESYMVKGKTPLVAVVHEILYWKLSSFFVQYKSSSPPSLSFSQPSQSSAGIVITTAAWFIASIFIISDYGAVFSAENQSCLAE